MEALAPQELVREMSKIAKHIPNSLVHLSLVTYLRFLEEECSAFVLLTTLDSKLWNPVKSKLFETLKNHLKQTFKDDFHQSGLIRTVLMNQILAGKYPSCKYKNSYSCTNSRYRPNAEDTEDFDTVTKTLDSIKNHGRKCSSICCTGAFIAETMLTILVNEDISHLVFEPNLCDKFYSNKPIKPFMFFDITSVLAHYIKSLDILDDLGDGLKTPALSKLMINSPNLGSLTSQSVYYRLMSNFSETKHYQDYPYKLSEKMSRPTSQFLMLKLSHLFDRSPNYFTNLTILKLSGECINTRVKCIGPRGGHAVINLMAGLAQSCPVLEVIDFAEVTSLCPESLIYLAYQDAFSVLHKYMYLPDYLWVQSVDTDEEGFIYQDLDSPKVTKHSDLDYCPWCQDQGISGLYRKGCERDVNSSVYVLDDRLYDYIEAKLSLRMLLGCVKSSQLIKAFTDPIKVLERPKEATFSMPEKPQYMNHMVDEVETKSPLCFTLKQLRLPCDNTDSKAWILPLLLNCMPNLTSLGETNIYEGLKLMTDIKNIKTPTKNFRLEEIIIKLDEGSVVRIMAKQFMRLLTLSTNFIKWNKFVETLNPEGQLDEPCLEHWVQTVLKDDLVPLEETEANWKRQISTIVKSFPNLKMMKITIKPGILAFDSCDIWQPLTLLKSLENLWIFSSSRIDIVSLLSVIGSQLSEVNLMFSNQKIPCSESADGLVNVLPFYCPSVKKVFFGHWQSAQGSIPHSLCDEDKFFDNDFNGYTQLTHFEAAGNILQMAFLFLWERAQKLESIRISGEIVNPGGEEPVEAVFSLRCIESYFRHNPMKYLKRFDVPVSFASLPAANKFLELIPINMEYVAMLTITIDMNDVIADEAVEDAISTVFTRMVNFKLSCKRREVEQNCQIKWKWKPEGLLTILLNQQLMTSMAEFVQP